MCQKQPTPKYTSVRSAAARAGWGSATRRDAAGMPAKASDAAAEVRKPRRPEEAAADDEDESTVDAAFAAAVLPAEGDDLALYAAAGAAQAAMRERRAAIFAMVVVASFIFEAQDTAEISRWMTRFGMQVSNESVKISRMGPPSTAIFLVSEFARERRNAM
jgi:hypothetical protein